MKAKSAPSAVAEDSVDAAAAAAGAAAAAAAATAAAAEDEVRFRQLNEALNDSKVENEHLLVELQSVKEQLQRLQQVNFWLHLYSLIVRSGRSLIDRKDLIKKKLDIREHKETDDEYESKRNDTFIQFLIFVSLHVQNHISVICDYEDVLIFRNSNELLFQNHDFRFILRNNVNVK